MTAGGGIAMTTDQAARVAPGPALGWASWLTVAGAVSGSYAGGIIGAIAVGGLLLFISRWRKAHITASLILIPLAYFAGTAMRTEQIRQRVVQEQSLAPVATPQPGAPPLEVAAVAAENDCSWVDERDGTRQWVCWSKLTPVRLGEPQIPRKNK